MTAADGWTIGLAILLVAVAGVLAGIEVAFTRVSRVRAEELAREDGRAAQRLLDVTADPARYVNLVLLLRVACELTAVVLVTVVCLRRFPETWQAILFSVVVMVFVAVAMARGFGTAKG